MYSSRGEGGPSSQILTSLAINIRSSSLFLLHILLCCCTPPFREGSQMCIHKQTGAFDHLICPGRGRTHTHTHTQLKRRQITGGDADPVLVARIRDFIRGTHTRSVVGGSKRDTREKKKGYRSDRLNPSRSTRDCVGCRSFSFLISPILLCLLLLCGAHDWPHTSF